jgi:uncharacterized membrane protein YphA (DoxX/SURF4 family)
MRATVARVDAWCRRGDFTVNDIAMFRILFAGGVLLTLQPLDWIASLPAEQFNPPPGPMMLISGFPPHALLEKLEVVTAILAALLLLGLWTRTVSILLALALMTGFGLVYSVGKIDHTIALVLVPATMAFSAWGQVMSFDARSAPRDTTPMGIAQWPMRLLAVMIGLSFVTAGWSKIRTGWLDPNTHAVQGHFARGYFAEGRTGWFAPHVIDLRLGRLWEVADWFTVALELGLVLAVFSWRWFRAAIAVATLFHLGVLLMMNIVFSWNIFGYGAFVRWNAVLPARTHTGRFSRPLGCALAVGIGALAYVLHEALGPHLQLDVRIVVIMAGGTMGAAYLGMQVARLASAGTHSAK